jgi:hypothetical protein
VSNGCCFELFPSAAFADNDDPEHWKALLAGKLNEPHFVVRSSGIENAAKEWPAVTHRHTNVGSFAPTVPGWRMGLPKPRSSPSPGSTAYDIGFTRRRFAARPLATCVRDLQNRSQRRSGTCSAHRFTARSASRSLSVIRKSSLGQVKHASIR